MKKPSFEVKPREKVVNIWLINLSSVQSRMSLLKGALSVMNNLSSVLSTSFSIISMLEET